ncbi:jerky protein homolog-like, partial [Hylaeus volcanicus]
MAQPPKKAKTSLNLKQKVDILSKLDKGVNGTKLATEYGVTKSTISYIKSKKSEILSSVTNTNKDADLKRLRKPDFPELEEKLYAWFRDQRERNCPVNGVLLKAKAKDLFPKLYPDRDAESFQASDGWFHKFKKRVGIRFLKICGEKLDCDHEAVRPFLNRLNAKIDEMQLTKEQVYNADETGLYYRLLPEYTYVSEDEKVAAGHKKAKERVSILLCSNATGTHKVKPLVIGKARKPRCFKGFKNPLDYDNSKSAWMTLPIFTHWFNTCFVKQVRIFCNENNLPKQAILLVDNCTAHGSSIEPLQSDDQQIICYFLPPNVTAILQPMDQGPIKITKLKYRNLLLCKII